MGGEAWCVVMDQLNSAARRRDVANECVVRRRHANHVETHVKRPRRSQHLTLAFDVYAGLRHVFDVAAHGSAEWSQVGV